MGSRRTLILIASVVIGAIAAFALYTYVQGVEDRAFEKNEPAAVYVVKQAIVRDTEGAQARAQNLIVESTIPRQFRPPTAVVDLSVIDGKVAAIDLSPGVVVTDNMFIDRQQSTASLADRLGQNEVAVSVSLDQVHSVGGRLQPGDKVMMMVTLEPDQAAQAGITPPPFEPAPDAPEGEVAPEGSGAVKFLYQDVEILAIGEQVSGEVDGESAVPASSGLLTLRVSPEAAERIVLVNSQIYLALAPKTWTPRDIGPVDFSTLFNNISSKA